MKSKDSHLYNEKEGRTFEYSTTVHLLHQHGRTFG